MCADGSPMADLLASLRRWEELRRQHEELDHQMDEAARPLEEAARAAYGGRYAVLVRQDRDGRVRFTVEGFAERTFSLEELAGGS